ncbi:MAG TPA: hypothetical protein VGD50_07315 [Candidatus Baltobacteraceae bacterium]
MYAPNVRQRMMSRTVRNIISGALLVASIAGLVVQYNEIRTGVPGQHSLIIPAYIVMAIYAGASIYLRTRGARG